jgi:glucosamine--fructose-6-phosphate aminotransferase (isomerizing)
VISSLDTHTPLTRDPSVKTLEMSLEAIEKGGYAHFMLKEIMEQPRALTDAMRGRVNPDTGEVRLANSDTCVISH